MKLLNMIQAKAKRQPCAHMYVETVINDKSLQVMLDTKVDTIYMEKELANEVGIP